MDIDSYQSHLQSMVSSSREIANEAREQREDPKPFVEMEFAENIAERCEKLLMIDGLADAIQSFQEDGLDREEIAIAIADEFAEGNIGSYDSKENMVDAAIRSSVALLTEGVVAAPIDGIGEITIESNDDGSEFIRIPYYGPIRSAGGTGQALSILVADYIRQQLGIDTFKPRDDEIERYVEEIHLYDGEVGLQYMPSDGDVRKIIENTSVMVDGVQTTEREVDGFRDLERIQGNRGRGGMCLVVGEGIAQKAPKLQKYTAQMDIDGWEWLDSLKTVNQSGESTDDSTAEETREDRLQSLKPKKKFVSDLIGGRPVFSEPQRTGGFRLRYGRARNTGIAACGYSPATMVIVDEFLATGTQLKTERPGKAAGVAPVDSIEGPTVRLESGELRRIDDVDEAYNVLDSVEKIYDLGEVAIPYGEFLENNHPLAPASYVHEWWIQELEAAGGDTEHIDEESITLTHACSLSCTYGIPLHPSHTYYWTDITADTLSDDIQSPADAYALLSTEVQSAMSEYDINSISAQDIAEGGIFTDSFDEGLMLPERVKPILEQALLPHTWTGDACLVSNEDVIRVLALSCSTTVSEESVVESVTKASGIEVRERAPLRIGARLGRPEKSFRRQMSPSVHSLFPIGEFGGNQRDLFKALLHDDTVNTLDKSTETESTPGVVNTTLATRECNSCGLNTWKPVCPDCDTRTTPTYSCPKCNRNGSEGEDCPRCEISMTAEKTQPLDINAEVTRALEDLGLHQSSIPTVKMVKRLTSSSKVPEPIQKGILRSKHDVEVFRDGTSRYDIMDLPLTAFSASDIGKSVDVLHELGYETTLDGDPITSEDDLVELFPQDMILSRKAGEYLVHVSQYIDELLESYYGIDAFYNADTVDDLIGRGVLGLAPHTSAGVLARIVGFTDSATNLASPFYHAAKRRNCFHPDTELSYKLNGEWNRTTIQELVETHLTDNADDSYDDGSIVQDVADHPEIEELKVPSMTDNGLRTLENVTHLSKHAPEEELIKIEADDGTEIRVTKDHKFPINDVSNSDLMVQKEAHNLTEGDTLFDYNEELRGTVQGFQEVDMLEQMLQKDHAVSLENVMIRGMEKEQVYTLLREKIEPDWEEQFYTMSSSCEYLGITKKTLDKYLRRQSIPVSLFQNLYSDKENTIKTIVEKIPRNVKLGMNSDNVQIPRMITIDEELATLVGYFTAEGYTRELKDSRVDGKHNGSTHIDFSATEAEAREFIEIVLEKKFDVTNPYTDNENRITASGQMVRQFFVTVLDAGNSASEKKVPVLIQNASERIQRAYLSGYISGDGYLDTSNNTIGLVTTSEKLVEGLETLLEKFGYSYWKGAEEPVSLHEKFSDYYDEDTEKMSKRCYCIELHKEDGNDLRRNFGMQLSRKNGEIQQDVETKEITNIEIVSGVENTYNLTVSFVNRLEVNSTIAKQCDGDEDSVMLLMDGLLNFSKEFLPTTRGKSTMDSPLVVSTTINPAGVDDEAHNVDIPSSYTKEFYEATYDIVGPKEVDVPIAESITDTGMGFKHTLQTSTIDAGPRESAYKNIEGMDTKTFSQLNLAKKLRPVNEQRIAELVIEKHFLPDIIGNLTAFGRQSTRCHVCGEKYRRVPLRGDCHNCGTPVILTVHEGSVTKYLDLVDEIATTFNATTYTTQRVDELRNRTESLFEDDKNKQSDITDFF